MAEQEVISRLQGGVLTALVHVVAVREPSCKALALEFVAARNRAKEIAAAATTPSAFRDVFFVVGLSPALFKKALEHQRKLPQRRLDRLGRQDLLDAIGPDDREAYSTLVFEVAEAAANEQVDDDPYRRRGLASWERSALLEIETVLTTQIAKPVKAAESRKRAF